MHGLPLRKPAPLCRISSRRAVVVVLLLAAGFLLAMPSAADAHVVKAHRAQYAAMLKGWVTTHSMLEQVFDGSSSSLNAMSNAISALLGSQDPNDQTALQTLEASAQEAATTIAQAAGNAQNRVDKAFHAAEHKVRQSWFSPPKAQTKYHQFLFQASQVGMYISDYCDAMNDLAAGGVCLHAGDISDYDKEALAAVNMENTGNGVYSAGMDGLMALR